MIVMSAPDLRRRRDRAHGRGSPAAGVRARRAGPGGVLVRQPGHARQHRGHGAQHPLPAEVGRRPATAVAGVGLNSVAGGIVHAGAAGRLLRLVRERAWGARSSCRRAARCSWSSPWLLALLGAVMLTRWGRRKVLAPVVKGVRSSASNLRQVAKSPAKLAHAVRRLADDDARLHLRVRRRGGGASAATSALAKIGAVFLGARPSRPPPPRPGGLGALEAALVAGPHRRRHGRRARGVHRAHLPPGDLLAAGAARDGSAWNVMQRASSYLSEAVHV